MHMSECYLAFTETPHTKLSFWPYLFKGTNMPDFIQVTINGLSIVRIDEHILKHCNSYVKMFSCCGLEDTFILV